MLGKVKTSANKESSEITSIPFVLMTECVEVCRKGKRVCKNDEARDQRMQGNSHSYIHFSFVVAVALPPPLPPPTFPSSCPMQHRVSRLVVSLHPVGKAVELVSSTHVSEIKPGTVHEGRRCTLGNVTRVRIPTRQRR